MMMMMYIRALVLYLLTWITDAYHQQQQQPPLNFTEMKPNTGKGSIFLRITGNVYPLGYYAVKMAVGNPAKEYLLDIDTGSDLTWIFCDGNRPHPPNAYDFTKVGSQIVKCQDPDCTALGNLRDHTHNNCRQRALDKAHPCEYTVDYADGFTSTGFLVKDWVSLDMREGRKVNARLAFGCGFYPTKYDPINQHRTDGMLGLGKGEAGILKQLSTKGVTENVFGHCFSSSTKGGGFIYFGDVPLLGIVWRPTVSSDEHYSLGLADIMFHGEHSDIRDLYIIFDSGSTYTYLMTEAYEGLLDLIERNLLKRPLVRNQNDRTQLPVCWKGPKPFKYVDDEVSSYFGNLALSFQGVVNVQFQMKPSSYLIISDEGHVCLGILDGGKVGLGNHLNLIGDISMHDKLVIYDNKRAKVGWADAT